ncbi:Nucleotidylyl transferase, partial [Hortaea werneckii]
FPVLFAFKLLLPPPLSKIPTLIPCAIDQEPYFRILRDRCDRMTDPHPKTCLILSKFLTALQGPGGKMSASDANSAIFMSDTASQIKNKINRHAFSGGRESLEEHRQLGGNPDVDVAYTYLSYFLESDDELAELAAKYRSGEMLTGEMKQRCIAELQKFVGAFQERRAQVDHSVMREYMRPRKLVWGGNPSPTKPAGKSGEEGKDCGEGAGDGAGGGEKRADGRGTKGERKAAKRAAQKEEKLAARPKQQAQQQKQGGEAPASSEAS